MSDKVLILGAGFLGTRIAERLKCETSTDRIIAADDAERIIKQHTPRILINAIGSTGKPNVDDCENKREYTILANATVPILLCEACVRNNVKLVHISSGCIYHYNYAEDTPIVEEETPDFFGLFYSRTKIYSEQALLPYVQEFGVLILRVRIPLDNVPGKHGLLDKLLRYNNIIDIPNSVTYIPDFLDALEHLLSINASGLFNVVNRGGLRYSNLLEEYRKYRPDYHYTLIPHTDLGLIRTNLIMSTKRLEDSGFLVRHIDDVIEECVRHYCKGGSHGTT